MAFTEKQREWFHERDGGKCMFHERKFRKGKWVWVRCNSTKKLAVHHVVPARWAKAHLPGWNKDIPTNGIVLCRKHHCWVHPDLVEAFAQYHNDPKSFEKMLERRDLLVLKGEIYWVADWDWMLRRLAQKNTFRFRRKGGPAFPKKGKRK